MTKEELIRAIITRKDFRFTHEEMMHMNTQQLREIYNTIAPVSLANDDERIRKWILEYLHDGLRKTDEQFKDHFKVAIAYLEKQKEIPMPDSTKLIELWHEDKEMLKEKDFRNDPWRLAYNAFLCGFGRGIAVNKQEQPEVDLEKEYKEYVEDDWVFGTLTPRNVGLKIARHFFELGLKARKEDNNEKV